MARDGPGATARTRATAPSPHPRHPSPPSRRLPDRTPPERWSGVVLAIPGRLPDHLIPTSDITLTISSRTLNPLNPPPSSCVAGWFINTLVVPVAVRETTIWRPTFPRAHIPRSPDPARPSGRIEEGVRGVPRPGRSRRAPPPAPPSPPPGPRRPPPTAPRPPRAPPRAPSHPSSFHVDTGPRRQGGE